MLNAYTVLANRSDIRLKWNPCHVLDTLVSMVNNVFTKHQDILLTSHSI